MDCCAWTVKIQTHDWYHGLLQLKHYVRLVPCIVQIQTHYLYHGLLQLKHTVGLVPWIVQIQTHCWYHGLLKLRYLPLCCSELHTRCCFADRQSQEPLQELVCVWGKNSECTVIDTERAFLLLLFSVFFFFFLFKGGSICIYVVCREHWHQQARVHHHFLLYSITYLCVPFLTSLRSFFSLFHCLLLL